MAICDVDQIKMQTASDTSVTLEDCLFHQSRFYYEGEWHDAPIYWREKLHSGLEIAGPAIVMEMDSTTVVLPGYVATVDSLGNILINPAA